MTKAKIKFNEYINSSVVAKIVVTKDAVICLPNDNFAKQIAKEQKKELSGIVDKIRYSPMILNGADIERTDFYCGGNYDNRYSSVAEIKYLSVIDNPDVVDKSQTTSIFVCAKTPEKLKSTSGTILDILDDVGAKTKFYDKDGFEYSAGRVVSQITIGNVQSKPISAEGNSVGLSHSKSVFETVVDAILEFSHSESEM